MNIKPGDLLRTKQRAAPHIGVSDDNETHRIHCGTNVIVLEVDDEFVKVKLADGVEVLMYPSSFETKQ